MWILEQKQKNNLVSFRILFKGSILIVHKQTHTNSCQHTITYKHLYTSLIFSWKIKTYINYWLICTFGEVKWQTRYPCAVNTFFFIILILLSIISQYSYLHTFTCKKEPKIYKLIQFGVVIVFYLVLLYKVFMWREWMNTLSVSFK